VLQQTLVQLHCCLLQNAGAVSSLTGSFEGFIQQGIALCANGKGVVVLRSLSTGYWEKGIPGHHIVGSGKSEVA